MVDRYFSIASRRSEVEAGIPEALMLWAFASVAFSVSQDDTVADEPIRTEVSMPPRRAKLIPQIHRALSQPKAREVFPGLSAWLIESPSSSLTRVADAPPLPLAPAFRA